MYTIFLRVVSALTKYGSKAVRWAWANRQTIYNWISSGMAVEWIVQKIRSIVGA